MNTDEFKKRRKMMGLTQHQLAEALGLSRKTIIELEAGRSEIDERTALAMQALGSKYRLIEDSFWVDETIRGTYAVVRRTVRELPSDFAMFFSKSELMLYGEFRRRFDAYRWCLALEKSDNPRNTRSLIRKRRAEFKKRTREKADEFFPA